MMPPPPCRESKPAAATRLCCRGVEYYLQDLRDRLASPTGCLNDELVAVICATSIKCSTRLDRVVVPYYPGACMAGSPSHLQRLSPSSVLRALGGRSIRGRYAMFIVHVSGNHWIACAAHMPSEPAPPQGQLAFYDSLELDPSAPSLTCGLGIDLTGMARRITEHLNSTLGPAPQAQWDVRMVQAPLQRNAYDCGLHAALVLAHLDQLIEKGATPVDIFSPLPWPYDSSVVPSVRTRLAETIQKHSQVVVQASDSDDGGDRLEQLARDAVASSGQLRWKTYATVQALLRQHNPAVLENARARGWDGVMDHDLLSCLGACNAPEWQIEVFSPSPGAAINELRMRWAAENIFICLRIDLNFTPLLQIEHGVLTLLQRPDQRKVTWCDTTVKLSLQDNKADIGQRSNSPLSSARTLSFMLHGKMYQITLLLV